MDKVHSAYLLITSVYTLLMGGGLLLFVHQETERGDPPGTLYSLLGYFAIAIVLVRIAFFFFGV